MKNILLLIPSFFLCISIFAQEEEKPCRIIVRYDNEKKGICSNRDYFVEGVMDNNDYEIKRKHFLEVYKGKNVSTVFISAKQSVIIYEYKYRISGWACTPHISGVKQGASIENCEQQLKDYYAKYPKEFSTEPIVVYRWVGKGMPVAQERTVTENFGGVSVKYTPINNSTKGDALLTQFTNKTTNKLATILIKPVNGKLEERNLAPGETLTEKFNSKTIEIQVLYQDAKLPEPTDIIDFVKDKVRKIVTNENGIIKVKQKSPAAAVGVRG